MDMASLVFPVGAETAGVRRGVRSVTRDDGREVKVCKGVLLPSGQFIIGGVPLLLAFSMSADE